MPRVNIYLHDEQLAAIDAAAVRAGKSRSEYLVAAALESATGASQELSPTVRRRIGTELARYVREEMDV